MCAAPDYVVIGHATLDLLSDGTTTPGGTVTYSGLTAERLGRRVGIVTSAERAPQLASRDILVHCRAASATTVFENQLTPHGGRRQHLRASASPLGWQDIPQGWDRARIVHLGPLAQEVDPPLIEAFPGSLLGITPQAGCGAGISDGLVSAVDWGYAWEPLEAAAAVILSLEDLGDDAKALAEWRAHTRLLVLTLGRQGAIVYDRGREERVRAYDVAEVDPTGAGDVFAAAFLVHWRMWRSDRGGAFDNWRRSSLSRVGDSIWRRASRSLGMAHGKPLP